MCRAGVATNGFNVHQLNISTKTTGMRKLLHFPAIHKEKKKSQNQNTSVVTEDSFEQSKMAQAPWFLQRAQNWCCQRLCYRSDASGGLSLTPCLIPVQSSALCLLRDCMWPTVCLLLLFLRAPGLVCPLCIMAKLHFLWWLSLWLCMRLRWLFAPEVAVCIWQQGGRDTQLPALTFFVLLLDYSKGFGGKYGVQKDRMDKVSCFKQPWLLSRQSSLVRSALLSSLFLDTSPV